MTWVSSSLEKRHVLTDFDCGDDSLNSWLTESALRAGQQDTARTYVWTAPHDDRVVAYFAIAPTQIIRTDDGISRSAAVLDRVPAFMIAKLAVDLSLQGKGNGKDLAIDAIGRIIGAAQLAGGRLIVVDAIDDRAANFYKSLNFIPVNATTNRLYMKISTARTALGIT